MKSKGRVERPFIWQALNVGTWTQICMHACKRGLWACSDSLWGLLLRPQILFQKWKNCWYLWETMPWSLQSLQFLDSSWWMKMLNRSDRHRLGAAPRQASSARKGATKIATWTWFRIASMRPENLTNLNICHQFKPWLLGIESFWLRQVIRNWFVFAEVPSSSISWWPSRLWLHQLCWRWSKPRRWKISWNGYNNFSSRHRSQFRRCPWISSPES